MGNNHPQFLSGVLEQIQTIRRQLEQLESQIMNHLESSENGGAAGSAGVLPYNDDTHQESAEASIKTELTGENETEFTVLPIGEAYAPSTEAVMDRMTEKESWRTDIPGVAVKDIRSAISLNDRILFINSLFNEDPIAFKNALNELNAMPSFDEGARYILGQHREWNTESDVVYKFMMAVRRKLK